MKLLIVGKSATGKDTVTDILVQEHGYKRAESYTTRPKRTPNEKGHHYINSADGFEKIAPVTINGYEYFLTKEEIEKSDIIIVEPSGIESVCNACPDEAFYMLYLTADRDVRKFIYKKRNPSATDKEFESRENEENERFDALETFVNKDEEVMNIPNLVASVTQNNNYDEDSMSLMVKVANTIFIRHRNMQHIVRTVISKNYFKTDDNGHVLMQKANGNHEVITIPEDIFTAISIGDATIQRMVMDAWLSAV